MPAYAVSHKGSGFQTTRSEILFYGHGMEPKSIWFALRETTLSAIEILMGDWCSVRLTPPPPIQRAQMMRTDSWNRKILQPLLEEIYLLTSGLIMGDPLPIWRH